MELVILRHSKQFNTGGFEINSNRVYLKVEKRRKILIREKNKKHIYSFEEINPFQSFQSI